MHPTYNPANPMHVMSLKRKRETKSLDFIDWVSDFKFKWYSNLLLVLFYALYLLFGTQMLIELSKSIELDQEQQTDNLITIRKENLRNDILFFNFYKNIYNENNKRHNDQVNSSDGESTVNDIVNGKNNNKNNYLAYTTYKRDKAFRSKLDRELDELIEQVHLECKQNEFKKLKNFNESFIFIFKLLTTLGIEERVKALLENGDLYTKLFIIIYSLIGIPFTFLLIYYYSRLLTYWLSKLVCALNRLRRSKGQKKLKQVSSSLLNTNLDQNLKFVITNRSSIILPNRCINLNNLTTTTTTKSSLNELDNLDLNNLPNSSISYNELNRLQHNHISSNTSNSFNSFNNLNFSNANRINRGIRRSRSNFLNTPNRFSDFNVSCLERDFDRQGFNENFNGKFNNCASNIDLPELSTDSNLTTDFTSSQPVLSKSSLSINSKSNRNLKFSSTVSRTESTATNQIKLNTPDLEEAIPIILPLFIISIYLFIATMLIHQENSSLFDSFFLIYLSFTLNGIVDHPPEIVHFFWLQCVLVFTNQILLFTFISLVCKKILNRKL